MKNNVLVLVFWAVMFFGLFSGCGEKDDVVKGNGNVISQERTAEGFNSITLDGVGNVKVFPGENYKVTVITDSNLQERILTTVNENILYITQSSGSFSPTKLTIDVYLPELTSISLNGAGNFTVNNGNASELIISISGTGSIDAQNYQVQSVHMTHSGVGNVKIWATDYLNGTLSGVGNIQYKDDPIVSVNISGVGSITPL